MGPNSPHSLTASTLQDYRSGRGPYKLPLKQTYAIGPYRRRHLHLVGEEKYFAMYDCLPAKVRRLGKTLDPRS